jgi:hypothetical protein
MNWDVLEMNKVELPENQTTADGINVSARRKVAANCGDHTGVSAEWRLQPN